MASRAPGVRVCATTLTGFEPVVAEEARAKFELDDSAPIELSQARVFFSLEDASELPNLRDLKSCNHLYLVVQTLPGRVPEDESSFLRHLEVEIPHEIDWEYSLDLFNAHRRSFVPRSLRRRDISDGDPKPAPPADRVRNPNIIVAPPDSRLRGIIPSFRVTCLRASHGSHTRHGFTSMEAAARFGAGLHQAFDWPVELTAQRAVDITLFISDRDVWIGLRLTPESLHRRHLAVPGPTSLLNSIAYCMVHLARPQPGDLIIDPMCGGGTVSIESAISWPQCAHICGDSSEKATTRAALNFEHLGMGTKAALKRASVSKDIFRWDATNLPLKGDSIDVLVTDLPFGKRIGSSADNLRLYPLSLHEFARVARRGIARCVLLTSKAQLMKKTIARQGLWRERQPSVCINQGGIRSHVFVLQRTEKEFALEGQPDVPPKPRQRGQEVKEEDDDVIGEPVPVDGVYSDEEEQVQE